LFEIIIVILALLIISFICSVMEAVILSISRPYIQLLIDRKSRSGRLLLKLKEKIEEPISAILTLNTISHTVGAAVSGALALKIFGSEWMALFSAVLTLLILIFSEIIPKTLGAQYWKQLGPLSAYVLKGMIFILKPFIVPIHLISRLFSRDNPAARISKGEVINYIRIGHLQGVIKSSEFEIVENLFQLQSIRVKEIMTPRTVVFWLNPNQLIENIHKEHGDLQFSRMPLYNAQENTVEGVVLRRDIMNRIVRGKTHIKLKSLAQSPKFVIETISVYRLLNQLISEKAHLAIVINEFGDFTGIVTIEDAIETLLGREIVDESDKVTDMREFARKKHRSGSRVKRD
jgi:CBS domain containing-hemolysin-like protein